MKKVLSTIAIVAASAAFAQVGISGNTNDTPEATLDVRAMNLANKPDGVLIPRLTRAEALAMQGTIQESTLIYVSDATTGAQTGTVQDVDAKGFYYYDAAQTKWVKLGGGAGAGTDIYAADGTLAGDRVVTHNNNNLTYTTGTGEFIVDGTSRLSGAVYVSSDYSGANSNIREYAGATAPTYTDDDYMIVLTNTAIGGSVELPSAQANPGRIIYLINGTTRGLGFNSTATSDNVPFNFGTIASRAGVGFVSTGNGWYTIGR